MFDFLKKIFSSKEPEQEEINLEQLDSWFNKKVSELDYNDYFQEFFKQIEKLKKELKEKVKELQETEIPKEHKNVEDRVKNIVKGHRDNYAREMERFIENISLVEKEKFSSLEDYKQVLDFSRSLDKEINELAKRTAKSYQASQHLFFNSVESVFKVMGQLNLLMKNFRNKEFDKKINGFEKLKNKIVQLNDDKEKKLFFEKEINNKEKLLKENQNELESKDKELKQLQESSGHKELLELKTKRESKDKEIKENENYAFTFFSKLNKPLRKYERVALDDKLIKEYLDNSVKAFFSDEELKIKEQLQGLKKSLDTLSFDEKQRNNFLELIAKSETDFLDKLLSLGKKLTEEKEELTTKIHENKVVQEIEEKDKEVHNSKISLERIEKELEDLKSKLEKINPDKLKQEIKEKVNELFFVEATLV